MVDQPKLLAFAGSLRKGSYNKQLLKYAVEGAREKGAHVTEIDLADFVVPIYNSDDEEKNGVPEKAKALKKLLIAHDGFLIASPEYNSSFSGALKNAIDWASRPEKEDPSDLVAFRGKVAGILSASPSFLGGLRGLVHLRALLENIFVLVLPQQVTLAKAHEAFDEKGTIKDLKKAEQARELGKSLAELVQRLQKGEKR